MKLFLKENGFFRLERRMQESKALNYSCVLYEESFMERLREEFDLDLQASAISPTRFKTGQNKHNLRCDLCKRHFYVGKSIYEQTHHTLELDPSNNPFVCDDCLDEIEFVSFGRR